MYDQHQIVSDAKQQTEQRMSKQRIKRQRHVATTIAQQAQNISHALNDSSITPAPNISARPKTIYSSSSFSSSDESQQSESPPQVSFPKKNEN